MELERPCHIVIGAGSSGILLARKLLDSCDVILVVEGPIPSEEVPSYILRANGWGAASQSQHPLKEDMVSHPDGTLGGRGHTYKRGIGVGGTSNIHAMICTAGSPTVFSSGWPTSWNPSKIDQLLLEVEAMVPMTEVMSGVNALQLTSEDKIESDRGLSSALWNKDAIYHAAYTGDHRSMLGDLLGESNTAGKLTMISHASVQRVLFSAGTNVVSGVLYKDETNQKIRFVRRPSSGEVVLCCGVFKTPAILRASNIGRPDHPMGSEHLRPTSWSPFPTVATTEIGNNFMDHSILPYMLFGNWRDLLGDNDMTTTNGISGPSNGVHGWITLDSAGNVISDSSKSLPRVQLLLVDGRTSPDLIPQMLCPQFPAWKFYSRILRPMLVSTLEFVFSFSAFKLVAQNTFGLLVCNVHPEGRGTVHCDGPSITIEASLNSAASDRSMTRVGLTKARQIIHDARNKRGALFFEILPGPAFCYASSDMFWHIYCVLFSGTYYHGCGTCRMSDDGKGVVDSCLRVRGVGSLRIADASVFPTIPSGPIAAICMAVGLYAAELLTTKM